MLKFIRMLALLAGLAASSVYAVTCPTFAAGDTNYIAKLNQLSAGCSPVGGGTAPLTATYIGYGDGTNNLTGSSTLIYNTAAGIGSVTLSDTQTSGVNFTATNGSTGTAATAQFITSVAGGGINKWKKYSSGYTTAGLLTANLGSIENTLGNLLIANTGATDIIFAANGTAAANEVGRFSGSTLGTLSLGKAGSNVGAVSFLNATSGSITVQPPTGALGTVTLTLPGTTSTLVGSGAITSSGLTQATARLLGRTSASTGAVEEITVGSGLSLSAGSLTATGSGSSSARVFNGRLTLESGVPVSVKNSIGKTTIYFTPYKGNQISLYDGAAWNTRTFSEISMSLGTLTSGAIYDIFLYDNSGTVTADSFIAWRNAGQAISAATNATPIVVTSNSHGLSNGDEVYVTGALGNDAANGTWSVANVTTNTFELSGSVGNGSYTGGGWIAARSTLLTTQDGVVVKSGDATRLYVGSFKTTSTTATEDSRGGVTSQTGGRRLIWNMFNREDRSVAVHDGTASWTYTSASFRQANNNAGNQVETLVGYGSAVVSANVVATWLGQNSSARSSAVGIGLNTTTPVLLSSGAYNSTAAGSVFSISSNMVSTVSPGAHTIKWLEYGGDGTATYYGATSPFQSGLSARVTN